jgi:Pyridoxamine 5'-phosphate oxidase
MASWTEIEAQAPDLAAAAQKVFDAHVHKTLATIRKDGSPRISGTEARFFEGDLWLGSMIGARKVDDLRRDPRLALHSATIDATMAGGDAKLSGRAVEVTDEDTIRRFSGDLDQKPPDPFHLFRIDITELTLTRLGDPQDHLVIETWIEGKGLQRVERR